MTTEVLNDRNLEKQMGCMAGFFQLFDRHQILTGKRIYAAKRLPRTNSPKSESMPESESRARSPASSSASEEESRSRRMPSPAPSRATEQRLPMADGGVQMEFPAKLPLPRHVLELKEGTRSPWKFKEVPRLSLDSRASVDGKGSLRPKPIRTNSNRREMCGGGQGTEDDGDKQRRSPSVIARLMGLEPLPDAPSRYEPPRTAELRRSASESRIARDLFQFRLSVDGNTFQLQSNRGSNASTRDSNVCIEDRARDLLKFSPTFAKSESPCQAVGRGFSPSPRKSPHQRKIYYDSADFFPVPKQAMCVYGEVERRLKMRGIEERSQDLGTLKQIFEALQLKGLLRSPRKTNAQIYGRQLSPQNSPTVASKPRRGRRAVNESPPPSASRSRAGCRQSSNFTGISSPRRDPQDIHRCNSQNQVRSTNSSSPARGELNRRRPPQRKSNEPTRLSSPTHSPKPSSSPSPRSVKPTAEICSKDDECSSVSGESSLSTDTEKRSKGPGEYSRAGAKILERCDQLLHSIAEISASELQPSPVSVLDSASFYRDESSPTTRRCVGFGDAAAESEDEIWPPAPSSPEHSGSCDDELLYISEILRALRGLPEDSDIFPLLEKQRDPSKESVLRRRLVFDAVNEILDRKRGLPPWKAASRADPVGRAEQVWAEVRRIRAVVQTGDVCEVICGVLRNDLAEDAGGGWGEWEADTAELVLCIERQVFRDLVTDTIRSLASSAGKIRGTAAVLRRKLIF